VQSDELELTHEFVSQMLGVRRSGVTIASGTLKDAGLIEYTRGTVRIRDRAGLEGIVCACYRNMRHYAESQHKAH
jgi:hypothetical protein